MSEAQSPWWRGRRGEWYVVTQLALIAVVFLGPRSLPGLPPWPAAFARVSVFLGVALALAGAGLLLAGLIRLGANLTPLPFPKTQGSLIQTGPYALVRHPMYGGGVVLAFGWALARIIPD